MAVVTVTGEIPAAELGITDIHEHILCDLSQNYEAPAVSSGLSGDEKVDMTTLGIVTNNPLALRDNLVLSDVDLAVDEILEFGRAGGKTIVEVTTSEFGRDPLALRQIARATGINIVAGTGHYIQAYHSPAVGSLSIEALAAEMTKAIREGIGNSGVRAGVIGEIGMSVEIHPDERKVLAAAARVNGLSADHPRYGGKEVRGRRAGRGGMRFQRRMRFFSSTEIDNISVESVLD